MRMYVLKNESDFGCTILLPEEEDRRADMVARLIEKRPAVEAAFGEELNWKDYSDRQKFVVSQSIDGGWASPESG